MLIFLNEAHIKREILKYSAPLQMFAWISLGVVLVSTFTFVLGTFPEFQKEEDTGQPPPYPEAVLVMEVVGKWQQNLGNDSQN